MIGSKQITLGPDQLASGMASSDYSTDGALGNTSVGLNPFVTPGIMRGLVNSSTVNSNIAGNIIASCEDSNASSPTNRYYIDDAANAANYYSYNGATVTNVKTGTATGTTYVKGKTDFISYSGFFYASSPTVLNKWNGAATLTEAYQTFGDGLAHHPMIAYRNLLFIGDGNTLSTLNTGGTYTTTANGFTLDPKEKIVALGIDPGTGMMMISVQTVYDVSDTIPSLKAVYLYDGVSAQFTRKILVDDLITAFYNVGGVVYVGAGQTIGQWNGSGVTFLRKLLNVTLSNTSLPYKHNFSNLRNILFVADGLNLLGYGEVMGGKPKAWFNMAQTSFSNIITCVSPVGGNMIAISAFDVSTVYELKIYDISSTAAASCTMVYSDIFFPRPVFIRRVRIVTTGITTTAGSGTIAITSEKNVTTSTVPSSFVVLAAASPQYVFDFDFTALKVQSIAPSINNNSTSNAGIVRVFIYYDISE